ncbi:hypothetical protein ACFV6F_28030 [Kitasatospora phosalacinea]|uniref:hypothetical protein n=1 Tax=Kitasatospora phosalacinea TaxID=2065 RepID=UPI00365BD5AD
MSNRTTYLPETDGPVWTAAREAVSRTTAGTAGALTDREADARLVVTELASNAICHAGGVTGFDVRGEDAGSRLRISIENADGRHPHGDFAALRDPLRLGGRGWPIVQLLTEVCEVPPLPGGSKRVSVTLALQDLRALGHRAVTGGAGRVRCGGPTVREVGRREDREPGRAGATGVAQGAERHWRIAIGPDVKRPVTWGMARLREVLDLLPDTALKGGRYREDVLLVACELLANAHRHTPGPTALDFRAEEAGGAAPLRATVSVTDSGTGMPVMRPWRPEEPNGHGMHIVQRLAQDWGVVPLPGGKTVWAVMGAPDP